MPARGKTKISKERKAELVAQLPAFGGCAAAVARESGISPDVVERAARNPEIAALAGIKKAELAAGFASLTQKLLSHYELLVERADLDNKGTTLLGIVADKALLYANEPTQITATAETLRQLAEAKRKELGDKGWEPSKADELVAQVYPEVSPLVQ